MPHLVTLHASTNSIKSINFLNENYSILQNLQVSVNSIGRDLDFGPFKQQTDLSARVEIAVAIQTESE